MSGTAAIAKSHGDIALIGAGEPAGGRTNTTENGCTRHDCSPKLGFYARYFGSERLNSSVNRFREKRVNCRAIGESAGKAGAIVNSRLNGRPILLSNPPELINLAADSRAGNRAGRGSRRAGHCACGEPAADPYSRCRSGLTGIRRPGAAIWKNALLGASSVAHAGARRRCARMRCPVTPFGISNA